MGGGRSNAPPQQAVENPEAQQGAGLIDAVESRNYAKMLRDSHWPVACPSLSFRLKILPTIVAALVLSRVRYCLPVYETAAARI